MTEAPKRSLRQLALDPMMLDIADRVVELRDGALI
jgi:hypothetical protein